MDSQVQYTVTLRVTGSEVQPTVKLGFAKQNQFYWLLTVLRSKTGFLRETEGFEVIYVKRCTLQPLTPVGG